MAVAECYIGGMVSARHMARDVRSAGNIGLL
jgi:hypothetical protein